MNNLQTYDEFLNEGIVDKFKEAFMKWWKSFQWKEEFLRKLYIYFKAGSIPIALIYMLEAFIKAFPNKFPDVIHAQDISAFLKSNNFISYIVLVMWVFGMNYTSFSTARRKVIRRRIEKIRNEFANNEFKGWLYALIGDTKNKKELIDKLKEDGVLQEHNIMQVGDVFIVDFSGMVGQVKVDNPEDPYGEENWNDENFEGGLVTQRKLMATSTLSDKYNIKLRKIEDIYDMNDSVPVKIKYFGNEVYQNNIGALNAARNPAPPAPPVEVGNDGDGDDDWGDLHDDEREDRDYKAWIDAKREEGEVEDLEDGRIAVKVKPKKNRLSNFVVPGFDIKHPEIEEERR